jgi:hypothetical protein
MEYARMEALQGRGGDPLQVRTYAHTHTQTHIHTNTCTCLCPSLTHTHTLSLSLTLSHCVHTRLFEIVVKRFPGQERAWNSYIGTLPPPAPPLTLTLQCFRADANPNPNPNPNFNPNPNPNSYIEFVESCSILMPSDTSSGPLSADDVSGGGGGVPTYVHTVCTYNIQCPNPLYHIYPPLPPPPATVEAAS